MSAPFSVMAGGGCAPIGPPYHGDTFDASHQSFATMRAAASRAMMRAWKSVEQGADEHVAGNPAHRVQMPIVLYQP